MARTRDEHLITAFSEVLREERHKTGLSQEALALKCGIARTFMGLLESGKRQPALSVLFAIARGLDVSPHAVITKVEKRLAQPREEGVVER